MIGIPITAIFLFHKDKDFALMAIIPLLLFSEESTRNRELGGLYPSFVQVPSTYTRSIRVVIHQARVMGGGDDTPACPALIKIAL